MFERAGEMIKVLDQPALEKRRELEKESPQQGHSPHHQEPVRPGDRSQRGRATRGREARPVRRSPAARDRSPTTGSWPGRYTAPTRACSSSTSCRIWAISRGSCSRRCRRRRFPITGRNPQSAGASVRVDNVPCDFIFVGACNIQDLPHILSPLRSRIYGGGYEVLVETAMPDTEANRLKLAHFVAQEIVMDREDTPRHQGRRRAGHTRGEEAREDRGQQGSRADAQAQGAGRPGQGGRGRRRGRGRAAHRGTAHQGRDEAREARRGPDQGTLRELSWAACPRT